MITRTNTKPRSKKTTHRCTRARRSPKVELHRALPLLRANLLGGIFHARPLLSANPSDVWAERQAASFVASRLFVISANQVVCERATTHQHVTSIRLVDICSLSQAMSNSAFIARRIVAIFPS